MLDSMSSSQPRRNSHLKSHKTRKIQQWARLQRLMTSHLRSSHGCFNPKNDIELSFLLELSCFHFSSSILVCWLIWFLTPLTFHSFLYIETCLETCPEGCLSTWIQQAVMFIAIEHHHDQSSGVWNESQRWCFNVLSEKSPCKANITLAESDQQFRVLGKTSPSTTEYQWLPLFNLISVQSCTNISGSAHFRCPRVQQIHRSDPSIRLCQSFNHLASRFSTK